MIPASRGCWDGRGDGNRIGKSTDDEKIQELELNARDRMKWGKLYGMEQGGVACVLWIFGGFGLLCFAVSRDTIVVSYLSLCACLVLSRICFRYTITLSHRALFRF